MKEYNTCFIENGRRKTGGKKNRGNIGVESETKPRIYANIIIYIPKKEGYPLIIFKLTDHVNILLTI